MFSIKNSSNDLDKDLWNDALHENPFLDYDFLKSFNDSQKGVGHWFIYSDKIRLYAHTFSLSFEKSIRYTPFAVLSGFLKLVNINVIYLTNSFLTSIPLFSSVSEIELDNILLKIKNYYNYKIAIIPDFLFNQSQLSNAIKVEVDSEMILTIDSKWKDLNDYKLALKTKYRKKINNIQEKSSEINVKLLSVEDYDKYRLEIGRLFEDIFFDSKFSGPLLNTEIFKQLILIGKLRLDGYFLNDDLVAFSTDIDFNNDLYSYFVGFDKKLNKSHDLYARILLEQINKAIQFNKSNLVLGRTANEFKSNFGAVPNKSYIYIYIRNRFWSILLSPIITRLKIDNWKQRQPFKN